MTVGRCVHSTKCCCPIYYIANSHPHQQSQGQQGGSLPAQARNQLGSKAQAWLPCQGVYLCFLLCNTNQSLGLGSALPGHCLTVSAALFTVFVCGQNCSSFAAMFPVPFEFFDCGHWHAPLPSICVLHYLWLCNPFSLGSVHTALNSALGLSAYCTAKKGKTRHYKSCLVCTVCALTCALQKASDSFVYDSQLKLISCLQATYDVTMIIPDGDAGATDGSRTVTANGTTMHAAR